MLQYLLDLGNVKHINRFRIQLYMGEFHPMDVEALQPLDTFIEANDGYLSAELADKYKEPVKALMKALNLSNKKFNLIVGDNRTEHKIYALTKSRTSNDKKLTILRCLNFQRHWYHFYKKPPDISFESKQNKLIWRGVTTGKVELPANRFECVTRWYNKHPKIDVAFSSIVQNKDSYRSYVKDGMSISDLLEYKYILSIQGNDKDSGLQWKLNSNSLIFMAKPTIVTWLMEDCLIPNYHYIQVNDDFSNLVERYEWCEKHPAECKQIIENAHVFMRMFQNEDNERYIEETVLSEYLKNVNQFIDQH
jgi:hypothetical protein